MSAPVELDQLNLTAVEAMHKLGAKPLDPTQEWDALVLAEADLLRTWAGVSAQVAHAPPTAARANGLVTVDRNELDGLFGKFSGDQYRTAIFFALAHEFGHLCQFKHFGVQGTIAKPRVEIEAHADVLAGVWLAVRMSQAERHSSEMVCAAGLQLKGGGSNYPTHTQRAYLIQQGMALTAMLYFAELQMPSDYQSISIALKRQDVFDLYNTATSGLREIG